MAMENQHHIIQDHIPLETFWPNFVVFESHPHPHPHQIPSNSCQIVNGSCTSNNITIRSDQVIIRADEEQENRNNDNNEDEQEEEEGEEEEEEEEELGAMKEMMFKIAAMQPVDIDPSTIRKPKRRNVRISDDPQSVAARHRRERISEKIRILQRLVPGGTKMDTASMLDEAIRYVKFLKRQIRQLQATSSIPPPPAPNTTWALSNKGVTLSSTTTTGAGAGAGANTYGIEVGHNNCSNHPICYDN